MTRLDQAMIDYLKTPVGFAEGMLGMKLYPKQAEVLTAIFRGRNTRTSFRSCTEGGKTSRVMTAAILYALAVHRAQCRTTSGSWIQIEDQLQPSLHKYRHKFPAWKFTQDCHIATEQQDVFWTGLSTNDPGRFEGQHADTDRPLFIGVDEAKTVKDDIYTAIDRCKPTWLVLMSSPGYSEREFYRSHTVNSKFYQTIVQRASECPNWTREQMDYVRQKYGATNPVTLSMLDAEFMPFVEDAVINLRALEDVLAEPPPFNGKRHERKAHLDFAAGGDENVIAFRWGNRITLEACWREKNTMSAVGRFITELTRLGNEYGLQKDEIEGDADGLGKPMCDALAEAGWPVYCCHGNAAPRFDDHYANEVAEMWFSGNASIEKKEFILPADSDFKAQALDRKQCYNSKGKLALESKEDLKKRNAPSPDRADAVFGAMSPLHGVRRPVTVASWAEHIQEREERGEGSLIGGFDAGA